MSENKTKPTSMSADQFLAGISDEKRRVDSLAVLKIMRDISGEDPVMWGSSIVGFGTMHYTYASGREGDWMILGFSPRKTVLVLYGVIFYDRGVELLEKLGPHTQGKGCPYIKDLDKIDQEVLKRMIANAWHNKGQIESKLTK